MLDWLKRKPAQTKESRTGPVVFTGKNQAQFALGSDKVGAREYAVEGYQKNVVAFQAINKTADAVAAMCWIARNSGGEEVEVSPFLDLIRQPNPLQSGPEFMRAVVGFFRISGNSYLERVMVGQQAREMYALRPDRMEVLPSSTGFPMGYKFSVGTACVNFEADPRTGQSEIRHMKSFNPLDDYYGMSPLMAGAYAVDQHNESMRWVQSLLQNGAAPSGAMELGEGALTDDQFNRLKSEIDEKYSGSTNAGRPMLLEGGLKWTQMGMSPVDVAIIETKYSAARDISLALGVPPLLLNIPGDSTYSNYKEARLAFYEETVIPLAEYIRDELNAWLSESFGGVTLDIDMDKIPAIAEKRREMWMMADASSDLTINERRQIKGYDKLANGGDEILVSSSMIPLAMAVEPITLPPELTAEEAKAQAYGPPKTS